MTTEVTIHTAEQNSAQKRKKGFTLTEIAIVLGIIGLILGAIWVAAAAVYQNQRIAHMNTAILQTAQAVRSLYATAPNANGMTMTNLITSHAIPSDLVSGAATAIDAWPNGSFTVAANGDNNGFNIVLTSVPSASCIGLLTAVAGTNRDPGLEYVSGTAGVVANIGSAGDTTTTGTPITAAVTPSAAATSCATANGNVGFGFSLKS